MGTKSALRSHLDLELVRSSLSDSVLPSEDPDDEDFYALSELLVVGLVVVVPFASLVGDVPLLLSIPLVGGAYGCYAAWTGRIFESLVSGVFVLAIFNANVPVVATEGIASLGVLLVDPLAVGLLAILLYDHDYTPGDVRGSLSDVDRTTVRANWWVICSVGGFGMFVLWTFLSGIVGNGPSRLAALLYAVQETRHLLLLVVAVLTVRRIGVLAALYPLLFSIGGNLYYGVLQALHGDTFGLTYLGDGSAETFSSLVLGPLLIQEGFYAGGFVGEGRPLVMLLLLLLPFLLFVLVYGSKTGALIATVATVTIALHVRLVISDAAVGAMGLSLLVFTAILVGIGLHERDRRYLRGLAGSALGMGTLIWLFTGLKRRGPTGRLFDATGQVGGSIPSPELVGAGRALSAGLATTVVGTVQSAIVPLQLWFFGLDTLGIRLEQYLAAVRIALEHPLFGLGGQNFHLVAGSYISKPDLSIHNLYLAQLAATGIPGFTFFMISVGTVAVIAVQEAYRAEDERRLLWSCVVVGLVGFHALSFWVVAQNFQIALNGFWLFSGIVVGARAIDAS